MYWPARAKNKLEKIPQLNFQVNYKRLTKKVGRIKSHLTEEEIREMENDIQKKEFAEKYRRILRNEVRIGMVGPNDWHNVSDISSM